MNKLIILCLLFSVGCGDGSFKKKENTINKQEAEKLVNLSFRAEIGASDKLISGKLEAKGSMVQNPVPITISNLEQNTLKVFLVNETTNYFSDLSKISVKSSDLRSSDIDLDYVIKDKADEVTFTIVNYKELIKENTLEVNLNFGEKVNILKLNFRSPPSISTEDLSSILDDVEINGALLANIHAFKIKNTLKNEEIIVDLANLNQSSKIKATNHYIEYKNNSCDHSFSNTTKVEELDYIILPINKGFARAVENLANQNKSTVISLKPQETLELGYFVDEEVFKVLNGDTKLDITYDTQLVSSCYYSCASFRRYESTADRIINRRITSGTTGLIKTTFRVNSGDRILTSYKNENLGIDGHKISKKIDLAEVNFNSAEDTLKVTSMSWVVQKNSLHCPKGGRSDGGNTPN